MVKLHRDLIALRRADPVLCGGYDEIDSTAYGETVILIRFFSRHGDRLLIVNLGADLTPQIYPHPLLAPPEHKAWQMMWSSEEPDYGGDGTYLPETDDGRRRFPGHAAVLLAAR